MPVGCLRALEVLVRAGAEGGAVLAEGWELAAWVGIWDGAAGGGGGGGGGGPSVLGPLRGAVWRPAAWGL